MAAAMEVGRGGPFDAGRFKGWFARTDLPWKATVASARLDTPARRPRPARRQRGPRAHPAHRRPHPHPGRHRPRAGRGPTRPPAPWRWSRWPGGREGGRAGRSRGSPAGGGGRAGRDGGAAADRGAAPQRHPGGGPGGRRPGGRPAPGAGRGDRRERPGRPAPGRPRPPRPHPGGGGPATPGPRRRRAGPAAPARGPLRLHRAQGRPVPADRLQRPHRPGRGRPGGRPQEGGGRRAGRRHGRDRPVGGPAHHRHPARPDHQGGEGPRRQGGHVDLHDHLQLRRRAQGPQHQPDRRRRPRQPGPARSGVLDERGHRPAHRGQGLPHRPRDPERRDRRRSGRRGLPGRHHHVQHRLLRRPARDRAAQPQPAHQPLPHGPGRHPELARHRPQVPQRLPVRHLHHQPSHPIHADLHLLVDVQGLQGDLEHLGRQQLPRPADQVRGRPDPAQGQGGRGGGRVVRVRRHRRRGR